MRMSVFAIIATVASLVGATLVMSPGAPLARPRIVGVAPHRAAAAPAPLLPTIGPVDTEAPYA